MPLRTLFANRLLHVGVLVAVVIGLLVLLQDLSSLERTVVSVLPIVAWYLGVLYEQSLVLVNGLVDEDELKAVERDAAGLFR